MEYNKGLDPLSNIPVGDHAASHLQIATLLPLKEFSNKEAAIGRDRYGRTYTTSIADKTCKLENQLDELSNELSQMREKIDGTPSYLHQKQ